MAELSEADKKSKEQPAATPTKRTWRDWVRGLFRK
jgi:hypothetical protein